MEPPLCARAPVRQGAVVPRRTRWSAPRGAVFAPMPQDVTW